MSALDPKVGFAFLNLLTVIVIEGFLVRQARAGAIREGRITA
jgi:hypothetical protein